MSTHAPAAKLEVPHREKQSSPYFMLLAVLALAVVIWLIPPPTGVQPRAWHLLAIFVATIVGIILKPVSSHRGRK